MGRAVGAGDQTEWIEACEAPGGPGMRRISEIAAEHGIIFLPPQE
jgi:hypothetical protein